MSTKDLNVYSSVEHKSLKSLDQYPDLELTRFDDAYCYRLVDDHYPQYGFVKNVTIGVMKSDFCRYLLVYHFGGVYIDSDVVLKTHPRDWILPLTHIKNNTNNVINFVAGIEGIPLDKYKAVGFCGPIQIVQWTFGATKNHPILLHALEEIKTNFETRQEDFKLWYRAVQLTGPCIFTNALKWHFSKHNESFNVLLDAPAVVGDTYVGPVNQFNCDQFKYYDIIFPCNNLTSVIHQYAGSWKETNLIE